MDILVLASFIFFPPVLARNQCKIETDFTSLVFCGDSSQSILDQTPIRCRNQDILLHTIEGFHPEDGLKSVSCPQWNLARWNDPQWVSCFKMSFSLSEWCQREICTVEDVIKMSEFKDLREMCGYADGRTLLIKVQYSCIPARETAICLENSTHTLSTRDSLLLPSSLAFNELCSCSMKLQAKTSFSFLLSTDVTRQCGLRYLVDGVPFIAEDARKMSACFNQDVLIRFDVLSCTIKDRVLWFQQMGRLALELRCNRITDETLTTPEYIKTTQPTKTTRTFHTTKTYLTSTQEFAAKETTEDLLMTSTGHQNEVYELSTHSLSNEIEVSTSQLISTSTEYNVTEAAMKGEIVEGEDKTIKLSIGVVIAIGTVGTFLIVILITAVVKLSLNRKKSVVMETAPKQKDECYSSLDQSQCSNSICTPYDNLGATLKRPLPNPKDDNPHLDITSRQNKINMKIENPYYGTENYEDIDTNLKQNYRFTSGACDGPAKDEEDYENVYDYVNEYDYIKDVTQ